MICLHCRKEITASALHTRHGEWCAECERWLRARQQAGARKNKNTEGIIGNRCAWCGDISDAADQKPQRVKAAADRAKADADLAKADAAWEKARADRKKADAAWEKALADWRKADADWKKAKEADDD